jgi:hypothetical protein
MKTLFVFLLFLNSGFCLNAPNQIFNTSLTLTVRDDLGNTVPEATVLLFEKKEDYTKEQNSVEKGTTDEKGVVRFKKLKPIPYFILARKGDKDNAGGGEETKLEKGKFNKATVVIQ